MTSVSKSEGIGSVIAWIAGKGSTALSAAFTVAPVSTVVTTGVMGAVAVYEVGEHMNFCYVQNQAELTCGEHCILEVTSHSYKCNVGCTRDYYFHDEL